MTNETPSPYDLSAINRYKRTESSYAPAPIRNLYVPISLSSSNPYFRETPSHDNSQNSYKVHKIYGLPYK
jgi:hypothetical protein